MLKRITWHSSRTTQPKIEIVKDVEVVTWNSGDIEQVATKRVAQVARLPWHEARLWVMCALLTLFVVASVAFAWWWMGRYGLL